MRRLNEWTHVHSSLGVRTNLPAEFLATASQGICSDGLPQTTIPPKAKTATGPTARTCVGVDSTSVPFQEIARQLSGMA